MSCIWNQLKHKLLVTPVSSFLDHIISSTKNHPKGFCDTVAIFPIFITEVLKQHQSFYSTSIMTLDIKKKDFQNIFFCFALLH